MFLFRIRRSSFRERLSFLNSRYFATTWPTVQSPRRSTLPASISLIRAFMASRAAAAVLADYRQAVQGERVLGVLRRSLLEADLIDGETCQRWYEEARR